MSGVLFGLGGLVGVSFLTVRPLLAYANSLTWVEVPCTILSASLDASTGSKGTTARVAVRYQYVWQGVTYEGDRYDFSVVRTNVGLEAMRRTVAALAPGTVTRCWVDPNEPTTAVLERSPPPHSWFGTAFLLFPAAGIGVIYAAVRARRTARAATRSPLGTAAAAPTSPLTPKVSQGEVRLERSSSRVWAFLTAHLVALTWCGLVGVFSVLAVRHIREGGFLGWILVVVLVPFLLIGIVLLLGVLASWLNLFNPRVTILLDPSLSRLGGHVPFRWRIPGRPRRLSLTLLVFEEVTYRRGTTIATERSACHRIDIPVPDDASVLGLSEGSATVRLPSHPAAAPPLKTSNNKLVWQLRVRARLPYRLAFEEHFALPVRGSASPNWTPPELRRIEGAGVHLLAPQAAQPGENLPITIVQGRFASAGAITVQLGWYTDGRGTRDAAIVFSEKLPFLAPGSHQRMDIPVPESPWTFQGALIAVAWRLEVLDGSGRPLIGTDLVVAPGGMPARLPTLPAEVELHSLFSSFR